MRTCLFLLPIFLLAVYASSTNALIIHVPADSSTIQSGINGAVDGDTVLVADGTYTGDGNRDIDFLSKAIVLMSENGPGVTIIDCEGSSSEYHRGFRFHKGEDSSSVLRGFTIKNGYNMDGGGIYCNGSSPTIEGNSIVGNTAHYDGGGIYCSYTGLTIAGNTISDNFAYESGGGIYYQWDVITERGGTEPGVGGNLIDGYEHLLIENNVIMRNMALWGGGISYTSSDAIDITIKDNLIAENMSGYLGGGIYCSYYYMCSSYPTIEGNTITRDYSNTIEGNTITGNKTRTGGGGGIACAGSYQTTVINTVLWDNFAEEGPELAIYGPHSSTLTISYCDVEGGESAVHKESTLNWGEGNIDIDPLFIVPEKTDCRLFWNSPCIDAGDSSYHDPDGTRKDIGAFFFNQEDYLTLYLTPDTTEIVQGGQIGVTYTVINRWDQPEPFWGLTQVTLPSGNLLNILGPDQFILPDNTTIQHHFDHAVHPKAPLGQYEYWTQIGLLFTLYDDDKFTFTITE
jgi:hypothetical protein